MKSRRAQASVEFAAIVALAFLLLFIFHSAISSFNQQISSSSASQAAKSTVSEIASLFSIASSLDSYNASFSIVNPEGASFNVTVSNSSVSASWTQEGLQKTYSLPSSFSNASYKNQGPPIVLKPGSYTLKSSNGVITIGDS